MGEENKNAEQNKIGINKDVEEDLKHFADVHELSEDELKELEDLKELVSEDEAEEKLEDDLQEAPGEKLDLKDGSEETEGEKDESLEHEEDSEEFVPEIDEELEKKIQAELEKKKKKASKKVMDREAFINYLKPRRNKIVYHALWHLVFNVDDHEASKASLYEALKEVTSKNPVEPIAEHKFYFGLGFILRLKLYEQNVVTFKAGKLKIAVNVENLKEILKEIGEPISDRPVLTEEEKLKMFENFLNDDFLDI